MTEVVTEPVVVNEPGKHLDAGQTNKGAPKVEPIDPGNKKPEGFGETFAEGTPEAKAKIVEAEAAAKVTADAAAKKAADEAAKGKDIDGPLKEFVALDHPAGQAAIDTLKEAGVGPNEANAFFAKAIAANDIKLVDWAGIEAKVGKAKAYLIRTGVESYYKDTEAKNTETVKAAIDIFGGQDNWVKVRTWAQTKEATDPAFKKQVDDIRDLLNEGGTRSQAGARELLRLYNSDPGSTGLQNGKLVVGEHTGNVIGTPLNRTDYLKEIKAANDSNASLAVKNAIMARRTAGRNQGL